MHALLAQPFHRKQVPGDLVPYQVHFTYHTLAQTFQKLKIRYAYLIDIFLNRVQSLQLQLSFGETTEIKLVLSEPVINYWVVIFGSEANKVTVHRRIYIMEFFIVFDDG